MKSANGKSIMMGAIIGILAVGVSFAAFVSTLTIKGTASITGDFNVKFTAVSASDKKATTTVPTIASEGVLSFDVSTELKEPGSESVITYTIKNLGTIDASLAEPSIACYSDVARQTSIPCSDTDFLINISESVDPTEIAKNETATGTITITWDKDSEQIPTNTVKYFTVTVNANQKAEPAS